MLNILVINSNPEIKQQFREILSREKQIQVTEVECAASVDTALLYRKYDVIFMEYSLPNVIDTDLIEYQKQCTFDQLVPLILVTRTKVRNSEQLMYPDCTHAQLCKEQISHKIVIKTILEALDHKDFQISDEQAAEAKNINRERFLKDQKREKHAPSETRDLLLQLS